MTALLELHHVAADIGQFHILDDIHFEVPENDVTVLMGRNGAGKTTTIRTMMGYIGIRAGDIQFAGESLPRLRPHQRCAKGISLVPEDGNVFPNLTVEDNFRLSLGRGARHRSNRLHEILDLFPDLKQAWKRSAGALSGGQRQMLAVGSALVQEPRCLLIDEPSKGLSPLFVERLAEALEALRGSTTILLVEQNFYLASRVGQHFVLIDDGHTVATGPMHDLIASDTLKQRYLGVRVAGEGGHQ